MKNRLLFNRNWVTGIVLLAAIGVHIGYSQHSRSTPEQLASESETIAIGKVKEIKGEWNAAHTRIFTRVTIEAEEYLKGSQPQNSFVVVHPGGEVREVGELYSHTPRFRADEEVLVFLRKDKQQNFRVQGGADGKFTISRDESTGQRVISKSVPLSEFKIRIREQLQQKAK